VELVSGVSENLVELVSGVAEELVSELSKLIRKMQYSRQLLL
jgi:hypothetical protein